MELEAKSTLKVQKNKFLENIKVVPYKKTSDQGNSFDTCSAWNDIGKDQGFLYVVHQFDNGTIYLSNFPSFSTHPKKYTAVYHIDDITLYNEPTKPTEPKENQDSVKVGEIYECQNGNMYYITEIKGKTIHGFGFGGGGKNWFDTTYIFHVNDYDSGYIRLGSKAKWHNLLLKECNRRGLTDGVKFKSIGTYRGEYVINYCDISFDYKSGFLCNTFGKGLIMKQGAWTDPIISIDIENEDEIVKAIPTFKSMDLPLGTFTGFMTGTKGTDNQDSEDVKPIINNPFKIGDNVKFLEAYHGIPKGIHRVTNIKNNRLFFSGSYRIGFEYIDLNIMKLIEPIDDTVLWYHDIKYTIGDCLYFKKHYYSINDGLYTITKISNDFVYFNNGKVLAISHLHNPEVITNLSFEAKQIKDSKSESLLDEKVKTTNNKQQLIKLKTKFKL